MSRAARLLGLAFLVLTACRSEEPAPAEPPQAAVDPHGDWIERMRHTPLESEVAINDEYEISAVFPKGRHVCTSDSGGHVHGFHQWLGVDCTTERPGLRDDRSISLWADYNAAEYSHEQAAETRCGADRAALKVRVSPDRGWVVSCHEPTGEGGEHFMVAFFAKERDPEHGFGPDKILFLYSVSLETDRDHRESDIDLFEDFLAKLELAGTRLEVDRSS